MPSDTPTKPRRATHLPLSANLQLAWRNVLRHKGRTATTLAAVTFGVVALDPEPGVHRGHLRPAR